MNGGAAEPVRVRGAGGSVPVAGDPVEEGGDPRVRSREASSAADAERHDACHGPAEVGT